MNWPLILAATVVTIFIIALVIALGLFWPSVSKMRWDYRNSSDAVIAKAPLAALVVTYFLAIPEMFKATWEHLKEMAPHLAAVLTFGGALATAPISFPAMALWARHDSRKEVELRKRFDAFHDYCQADLEQMTQRLYRDV